MPEPTRAAFASDPGAPWRRPVERFEGLPPWLRGPAARFARQRLRQLDDPRFAVPRVGWRDGLDEEIDAESEYLESSE